MVSLVLPSSSFFVFVFVLIIFALLSLSFLIKMFFSLININVLFVYL